jgi:hypothetical protein
MELLWYSQIVHLAIREMIVGFVSKIMSNYGN